MPSPRSSRATRPLVKPDVQTTLTALWVIDLLREAGVPTNVVQVVTGDGPVVGPMVDRPRRLRDVHRIHARRARDRRPLRGAAHRLLARARRQERDDHPGRCRRSTVQPRSPYAHASRTPGSCASRWSACTCTTRCTPPSPRRSSRRVSGHDPDSRQSAGAVTWALSSPRGSSLGSGARRRRGSARGHACSSAGSPGPTSVPSSSSPPCSTGVTEDMVLCEDETFGPVVALYRVHSDEEADPAGQRHGVRAQRCRDHPGHAPRGARSPHACRQARSTSTKATDRPGGAPGRRWAEWATRAWVVGTVTRAC